MHVSGKWVMYAFQAVLIGPMLMAGLTQGTRTIHANASDLAPQVTELTEDGLVSLKLQGMENIYLQQQGRQVVADQLHPGNAAAMAATFRMVNLTTRSGCMTVFQLQPFLPCCLKSQFLISLQIVMPGFGSRLVHHTKCICKVQHRLVCRH